MLRVYIDDSGKRDQSQVQVLAGYMASAARWTAFSDEWKSILDSAGIDAFRMSEAWRLNRKYQAIGSLGRDTVIVRLVECIKRHTQYAFGSSIPFQSYDRWFDLGQAGQHRALRPYFFGFYTMLSQVYFVAQRSSMREKIEVVFDEQGGESQSFLLSNVEVFRDIVNSDFSDLIVPTPSFQNDKVALPLQAADLLAWLIRRDAFNAHAGRDRLKTPEAVLLGEALSVPRYVKIWNDQEIKRAAEHTARAYLHHRQFGHLPPLFDQ